MCCYHCVLLHIALLLCQPSDRYSFPCWRKKIYISAERKRFFSPYPKLPDRLWGPLVSLCIDDRGPVVGMKRPGLDFITHLDLMQKLGMSGAIPLFPLYAFIAPTLNPLPSTCCCFCTCLMNNNNNNNNNSVNYRYASLTAEIRSEKCVVRRFRRCANVIECIYLFKVCKSVDHRTIQINHQPDATVFQFIILTFIYSSTCFGRFAAHYQELNDCSGRLWFYLRIVVTVVPCSWSGRQRTQVSWHSVPTHP